jgi:hypothetical protein
MLAAFRGRSSQPDKALNVLFALLGATALVAKGRYAGPYPELVRSYGGNVAGSFAAYFIVANLRLPGRFARFLTAGIALAVVELFEVLDGFGIMSNVYDPADLLANAVGILIALAIASVASHARSRTGEERRA